MQTKRVGFGPALAAFKAPSQRIAKMGELSVCICKKPRSPCDRPRGAYKVQHPPPQPSSYQPSSPSWQRRAKVSSARSVLNYIGQSHPKRVDVE